MEMHAREEANHIRAPRFSVVAIIGHMQLGANEQDLLTQHKDATVVQDSCVYEQSALAPLNSASSTVLLNPQLKDF